MTPAKAIELLRKIPSASLSYVGAKEHLELVRGEAATKLCSRNAAQVATLEEPIEVDEQEALAA